jgi:transposase InsO family protein
MQEEGTKFLHSNNFPHKENTWIIDSGATDHMTYEEGDVVNLGKPRKTKIINANGFAYPITGAGDVHISSSLKLSNTLIVPSLSTKLISVGQLAEELKCVVLMYPDCCLFQDILTGEIIGRGVKRERLYHLEDLKYGMANLVGGSSKNLEKVWQWHRRLGHPSFGYMKKLLPNFFNNLDASSLVCETCIKAKSHRVPYQSSQNKCLEPFDLVHADVWGPSPVASINGYKWFILFVDDCTRMTWVYLLKGKDEVSVVVKDFFNLVQNQFKKSIKMFRSDNGTEFINRDVKGFFTNSGVIHETSCVGTPQQNGVVERKNRHILETARALLFEYNVPRNFWENAVTMAVYVINRLPSISNEFVTPLKKIILICIYTFYFGSCS